MNRSNQALIAQLAEDLTPIRPMRMRSGLALVAAATAGTLLSVWLAAGFWSGMLTGEAAPFFFVTHGLLLMLGLASATAAIALARPAVGNRQDAPKWAAAMVAVLPLTALVIAFVTGAGLAGLADEHSIHCLTSGVATSALSFVALGYWLKRGAPVSTQTAGLFAGIAAGAIGSFAYGITCPIDGVAHLGLWHVLPVPICGALGRLVLPRLIRW
ncbi:DUF1109 domain-containing protein [Erythrobacter sp. SDW2]|uniref:NrsF family protein n=1 Tax=Erythrobacter sp. SDW2 TaxID=2907154 RepID=UPI001F25561A|nr:DUF1109 domain-containing protein [Erythrobacter sp. SDW2]UIP06785.1 DUF1109 domain-containing protein [Erythrobacter sp. SDW2]